MKVKFTYLAPRFTVRIDNSGRNRVLRDLVFTTDDIKVTLLRELFETILASESATFEIGKNIYEIATVTEAMILAATYIRSMSDDATAVDIMRIAFSKPLTDAAATSDANSITFGKSLSDSISVLDELQIAGAFMEIIADTAHAIDAVTKDFSKALTDTAHPNDAHAISLSMVLADAVTVVEEITSILQSQHFDEVATAVDAIIKSITKALTDSATATDAKSLSFDTPASDTATTSEAAMCVTQDFVDGTYFLEDFVGSSVTL